MSLIRTSLAFVAFTLALTMELGACSSSESATAPSAGEAGCGDPSALCEGKCGTARDACEAGVMCACADEAGACTPNCTDKTCGQGDGCGGVCQNDCPPWTYAGTTGQAMEAELHSVWGSGANDVYATGFVIPAPFCEDCGGGTGGVVHTTNTTVWGSEGVPNPHRSRLSALWGSASDDIYAVGEALIVHKGSDASWSGQTIGSSLLLNGVWGSSPHDVYAVGEDYGDAGSVAAIVHSTGDGTWTSQPNGAKGWLNGVWGSGPTDIYAVGQTGGLVHSTGDGSWTVQSTMTSSNLAAVWGSGSNDVYVVGAGGAILHSTGDGSWRPQASQTINALTGVWGSGADDVYVVGVGGTILHSTGDGKWTPQASGTANDLFAVWGSGRGDVYAVGSALGGERGYLVLHHAGN